MFKIGSFEDELMESMKNKLAENQIDSQRGFSKIAKATDFLSLAADLLDQADMQEEADDVTSIMESIAKDLSK